MDNRLEMLDKPWISTEFVMDNRLEMLDKPWISTDS
jgi:hypothetical protein